MGQLFSLSRCSAAGTLAGLWVPPSPSRTPPKPRAQGTRLHPSAARPRTTPPDMPLQARMRAAPPPGRDSRRNPFRSRFTGAEKAPAVRWRHFRPPFDLTGRHHDGPLHHPQPVGAPPVQVHRDGPRRHHQVGVAGEPAPRLVLLLHGPLRLAQLLRHRRE